MFVNMKSDFSQKMFCVQCVAIASSKFSYQAKKINFCKSLNRRIDKAFFDECSFADQHLKYLWLQCPRERRTHLFFLPLFCPSQGIVKGGAEQEDRSPKFFSFQFWCGKFLFGPPWSCLCRVNKRSKNKKAKAGRAQNFCDWHPFPSPQTQHQKAPFYK